MDFAASSFFAASILQRFNASPHHCAARKLARVYPLGLFSGVMKLFRAIYVALHFHIVAAIAPAAETGPLLTGKAAMGRLDSGCARRATQAYRSGFASPSSNILSIKPAHVVPRPGDRAASGAAWF